jgi:hypothetical protein
MFWYHEELLNGALCKKKPWDSRPENLLHLATWGFSEKIGHGGFGLVFQGELLGSSTRVVVNAWRGHTAERERVLGGGVHHWEHSESQSRQTQRLLLRKLSLGFWLQWLYEECYMEIWSQAKLANINPRKTPNPNPTENAIWCMW